jgi:hypothetical protein
VTVVDRASPARAARLHQRVAELRRLGHEHLAPVGEVVELTGGALAVLQAEVAGTDLETVRAARGAWSAGETVTVLVPLAAALAALHARGLTHGDVAAANVVLSDGGRPVLVDLLTGDDDHEAGTAGTAAPERVRGAQPPADVHALARLGLQLLGPDTESPSGRSAGSPPDSSGLAAYLRSCAADAPGERPGAGELAARVYALCTPEPVQMPDAAVLARAALRRLAEDAKGEWTVQLPRQPRARRARHRRRSRLRRPLVVVVTVALVTLAAHVTLGLADRSSQGETSASLSGGDATVHGDPTGAAVALTRARTAALVAGDREALANVTVAGSPAGQADLAVAERLVPSAPGRERAGQDTLEVVSATPDLPWARWVLPRVAAPATLARVRLVTRMVSAGSDSGAPEHAVVLVLRWTSTGWRVAEVQPAS